jgi:hypothetical protein
MLAAGGGGESEHDIVLWRKGRQNFRATIIVCHIVTYFHNFFCKDFPHRNCVKIFQRAMARKGFLEKRG